MFTKYNRQLPIHSSNKVYKSILLQLLFNIQNSTESEAVLHVSQASMQAAFILNISIFLLLFLVRACVRAFVCAFVDASHYLLDLKEHVNW